MATSNEVRYLNPPTVDLSKKKYCRFRKNGIKYIDYKDADFLLAGFGDEAEEALQMAVVAGQQILQHGQADAVLAQCSSWSFAMTGSIYDDTLTGKGGRVYKRNDGFCLETQHYPDSPNQPEFPSTVLLPGHTFRSTTVHRFSVR